MSDASDAAVSTNSADETPAHDLGIDPIVDELTDRSDAESASPQEGLPMEDETAPAPDLTDPDRLLAAIEAILFVVESPVSMAAIAAVLQRPTSEIEDAVTRIAERYNEPGRGVELRWIGDGVRIYTRPELNVVVEAFLLDGQRTKLSQAALETLAVIAYRQPVTRGRISAIRGVNVDGVVRTLSSRGLIVEDGSEESGAGLYRTTSLFLEKMGMQTLEELPSLAPLLPEIDTLETDEL
jgi:segregation and condensation protein B